MKLQNRILQIVVPLIVVPMLVIGIFAYVQLRDTTESQSVAQMHALLHQLKTQIDAEIANAQANLAVVSSFSLLERYMVTEDEENRYTLMQPSLLRLFGDFQKTYPDYYEIRILMPDGYEDARSIVGNIANVSEEERDSEYFAGMREASVYNRFLRNPDTGELALLASRSISLVDRAVNPLLATSVLRGYLVFTIRPTALIRMVEEVRLGHNGFLMVTDGAGRVLMDPQPSSTWQTLEPALFEQLRGHADSLTDRAPITVRWEEGESFALGMRLNADMYLFAMYPKQELRALIGGLGMAVSFVIIITILLITSSLYMLLKKMLVKPIAQLSEAAQEIGRGNLAADIKIQHGGEIGDLARAFREMGDNLQRSSQQVHYLAYHDSLTGLPNRMMFKEYLVDAIVDAGAKDEIVGLMFLDIDNFKQINDTLGHAAGDEMLQKIADILTRCLREADKVGVGRSGKAPQMVARLGGDEFTILLPGIRDPFAAGAIARRIQENLIQPIKVAGKSLYASTSIGITTYPADGDNAEDLIKHADIAMYHAKQLGKNNYQYYAESMNVVACQRAAMEARLRRALAENEFYLVYQPIIDIASRRMVAVEALIRWRDPEVGLIPPDGFIPIAEETGLIIPIGDWVLREACRQNKAWQDAGLAPVKVAVNISNVHVNRGGLIEQTRLVLQETGLAPRYLELEITETSVMSDYEHTIATLMGLRDIGVSISLDDFGTGYSSLSYLRHFPIDNLKIDRSFVKDIIDNTKDAAIIATIVAMGHTLGLKLIAEGVETPDQLAYLAGQGCDLAQGYLLSRPVADVEIQAMLALPRLAQA